MDTITGNEILEEFMEIRAFWHESIGQVLVNVKAQDPIYLTNWSESQFHSSWDWMIPVARKCINSHHDKREYIFEALHKCDLHALWYSCIIFIQWLKDPNSKPERPKNQI